jgi:DNA-directed RNA polymerase specialized sigma24 family protein
MLKRSGTTTALDPETAMLVRDVYSQHYDELLRKACIMLHDREDARDAVSEVMARLIPRALPWAMSRLALQAALYPKGSTAILLP